MLTAIIQSSSASVGILQGLCGTGVVTFGSAIPIILGQNIGTCITAILGAVGANRNARRTAMVHLLFNVVGVTIFVVLFYGLGMVIDWTFLNNTCSAWNIAVIHTCFNVAATLVLMPMNGLLVKLAYLIIPREQTPQKQELLDDLLTSFERTADHCSNVAVEVLQVAEGKLEAHEYLNALKSGELTESAAYAERFVKYKAQYAFPEEK